MLTADMQAPSMKGMVVKDEDLSALTRGEDKGGQRGNQMPNFKA